MTATITAEELSQRLETEIFPRVEQPSRYLGSELNAVIKSADEVDCRVALAFPDLYDLGLGNLGVLILYRILNDRPDCWAERTYAPAPDLETELRHRNLPLFTFESKTPLRDMDAIGFTLQYELTYTNILNILDLSGIPLRTSDRGEEDPITIAGGPCVFNPEPLAPFIDCFAIGDGEDVIVEFVDSLRETRDLPRARRLDRLAEIPGLYVPARFPVLTLADGGIVPDPDQPPVRKRNVRDLNAARYPSEYIVPFTQQVHDRVSLEVLRGCTQGCRFCQAGMTTRPVRERSLPELDKLMRETLAQTGYEQVALSSLSTCDYSRVKTLVDQSVGIAQEMGASVSLPSLRLDSFSVDLSDMVASIRKTGLTFAPEAATDRMRAVINKFIPEEELIETTREVFARGWDLVKLYFMIGLPTERDEDVLAIARLANRVLEEGRKVNRRARVNLGVSTFVPKPHTPFQWDRQISIEETVYKQGLLRKHLSGGGLKFGRHDAETSYLEGVISRGDRRTGDLIELAFRHGARLDGWGEYFDFSCWQRAFADWELDPDAQLAERELDAPLPWDHIDIFVTKQWLKEDCLRSRQDQSAGDCRSAKCHQCGVIDNVKQSCLMMLKESRKGAKEEQTWERQSPTAPELPEPVRRLRFRFSKHRRLRFLSHLETMNVFLRSLRRARIPIDYSRGFHPQPRLSFGAALPVGVSSDGEYAEVVLLEYLSPTDFRERMNEVLPDGIQVLSATVMPLHGDSLEQELVAEQYVAELPPVFGGNGSSLASRVERLVAADSVMVERWHKTKPKQIDVRPLIDRLEYRADGTVAMLLRRAAEGRKGKPQEILNLLLAGTDADWRDAKLTKLDSFISEGNQRILLSPLTNGLNAS